jgi:uncharacterized protein (DUF433 family)
MTAHITIEPGKRSGQPCIRGLRITVGDVLFAQFSPAFVEYEYLGLGTPQEEVRKCMAYVKAALA